MSHQRVISRLPQKQELSRLWDEPFISIQMVAEFIEGLPRTHKEKIWNRHSIDGYIPINKLLHILHSFVSLCIKLKDRSSRIPTRGELEDVLLVYIDTIISHLDNESNGLTYENYFNDIHDWLLEPVSGLLLTEEEALEWKQRIDELERQLLQANKEKEKLQRQTRIDMTNILDELNKDNLVDYTIKTKDELIDIIYDLKNKLFVVQKQLNVINESKNTDNLYDDTNNNSINYNNDNKKPGLFRIESELKNGDINLSELKNEINNNENNSNNNIYDDAYIQNIRLKIDKMNKNIDVLKNKKNEIYSRETNVLLAETEYNTFVKNLELREYIEIENVIREQYKNKMDSLQDELEKWIKKHETSEHIRNQSVSEIHNSLFTKLLEAENEHDIMVNDYEQKLDEMVKENDNYRKQIIILQGNKIKNMENVALNMDMLRKNIAFLNHKITILTDNQEILQNKLNINNTSNNSNNNSNTNNNDTNIDYDDDVV